MPSVSYRRWRTVRGKALDEIAEAHAALGGSARGRRYATQQINRAYAVLLAAEFQGFCRDLHSECVDHVLRVIAPPVGLLDVLGSGMTYGRQLDRGNANPATLGADFGRFAMNFWDSMEGYDPASVTQKRDLELLNEWRNAIAHQDFTSPKLGGIMNLRLKTVRRWRNSCARLARTMDEVLRKHLLLVSGTSPW